MKIQHLLLITTLSLLVACSQDSEENNDEHIWQHQTDALKEAKELQKQVNADNEKKQKQLDELEK